MKTVLNFIRTAAHYAMVPIKAYIKLAAKNYEKLYGKGYTGPMWM